MMTIEAIIINTNVIIETKRLSRFEPVKIEATPRFVNNYY